MRKLHNTEAGYIAERNNPHKFVLPPGRDSKVVIYIAAEQRIDSEGKKYAVVCNGHACWGGADSIPKARVMMKHPEEFCLDCREIVERTEIPVFTFDPNGTPKVTAGMKNDIAKLNGALRGRQLQEAYEIAERLEGRLQEVKSCINAEQARTAR